MSSSEDEQYSEISVFFKKREWEEMSSYDKSAHLNIRKNYFLMKEAGLQPKLPDFMAKKNPKQAAAKPTTRNKENEDPGWTPPVPAVGRRSGRLAKAAPLPPCPTEAVGAPSPKKAKPDGGGRAGKALFHCSECREAFVTASDLREHTLVHADKPFKCVVCKAAFQTGTELRGHVQIHQ